VYKKSHSRYEKIIAARTARVQIHDFLHFRAIINDKNKTCKNDLQHNFPLCRKTHRQKEATFDTHEYHEDRLSVAITGEKLDCIL